LATTFASGAEMDVKYQVFVSSTFVDLEVERRQVIEAILNLGHIPVGMEAFQASDDSQWDYIKRRIAECDYYVVIVGERYGSEFEGKSYTQMEYEFAMEAGLPVAAFLMSETAKASLPRDKVEFSKADKVKAFRELCQQKLCKHWDNGSDLASKVLLALMELTRERPMRGWVRPAKVPPEDVLQEMSMLLEKTRTLQAKVDELTINTDLTIPPDVLARIEELDASPLDLFFQDENYSNAHNLLDVFQSCTRLFAKGCDVLDLMEALRNDYEAFSDDVEVGERILAEFSLNKVVTATRRVKGYDHYVLSEYGKDFILYVQKWNRDNLAPPFLPGRPL
jgi:hypothetical protein